VKGIGVSVVLERVNAGDVDENADIIYTS